MQGKTNPPLLVVCLKCGTKYPSDYANRLHRMTRRHLSAPHRFLCLTDDPGGLEEQITHHPLPGPDLGGCWNKLWLFSDTIAPAGTVLLYLDLDVVVVDSLDPLLGCSPTGTFLGQPDWNRPLFPQFNSSVMRLQSGAHGEVLDRFLAELASGRLRRRDEWDATTRSKEKTVYWRGWRRFGGDQEWISAHLRPRRSIRSRAFPGGWVLSHKRHARPAPPAGAKIMVFHGSPKPHEVEHPYVREHWR